MDQLDNLEKHVNELVSKLSEIIQRLQKAVADAKKAVSFDRVKEIKNSIMRMKNQGIPVPSKPKALKIKLLSEHELHQGRYDSEEARKAYLFWLDSGPFDCGMTVSRGLRGRPNPDSQANGAMMRISPLGIFGANHDAELVAEWARQDAVITHPHPICQQANALFTMAIAHAVRRGCDGRDLYEQIVTWAEDMEVDGSLLKAVRGAVEAPPADYVHQQGWVLTAFRNALWQLLHAPNLEEAVVDTVMRGGDTDTNAAICGALLGAVWGRNAIPDQWTECVLNCRPAAGQPHVRRPRLECFWPVDALELAERLVGQNCSEDSDAEEM